MTEIKSAPWRLGHISMRRGVQLARHFLADSGIRLFSCPPRAESRHIFTTSATLTRTTAKGNNLCTVSKTFYTAMSTDNDNKNSDITRGTSPGPGRSSYVIFNNVVSTVGWPSGKQADDTITRQTELALKNLDERLTAAGTDRTRIIEVTVFLASVASDKDAMDKAWVEWCPEGCGVSRVIVGGELNGVKVFFKATAAMPAV